MAPLSREKDCGRLNCRASVLFFEWIRGGGGTIYLFI